jgi:hypothetical protein
MLGNVTMHFEVGFSSGTSMLLRSFQDCGFVKSILSLEAALDWVYNHLWLPSMASLVKAVLLNGAQELVRLRRQGKK